MEKERAVFKHNDLIWGKLAGHQWWPGTISMQGSQVDKQLYRVEFFGYPSNQSVLPASKIMKYSQYPKCQIAGNTRRASPELKRAMSEASILLNTLQQSKTSPIKKSVANSSLFDAQNTISSVFKLEDKPSYDYANPTQSLIFTPITSDHQIQVPQLTPLPIFINKKSNKKDRHSRNNNRLSLQKQVQELLRKYGLENIPQPVRQISGIEDKQIVKLLYKICKQHYNRYQSMKMVLKLRDRVSGVKQLKRIIREVGQGLGKGQ